MFLLALLLPTAEAADFLQVDAAAPGMAVQVNSLRDTGGFTGAEVVTTSCSDIVVGPTVALDRGADPTGPITGAVLSTVFFVDESASPASCTVYLDGSALSAFNAGIDNLFSIMEPLSAPTDGGSMDMDGAADGVITLSSSLRTDGGTLLLESLDIPAGETLLFDTSDPDTTTDGNEAFLPVFLLSQGAVTIDGTLDVSGEAGDYANPGLASDGGDGGPGGGGGGVGGNCLGAPFQAGDGFTGGGGNAADSCTLYGGGGVGATEGADFEHGGEGIFTTIDNGGVGYAGGTGGGTGSPWGTGGGGGEAYVVAGTGGLGGGGGAGHSEASGWGSGGGGFGSDGENGIGTLGGGASGYQVGGAGYTNGDDTLVPLGGGSGGGGGESGDGSADGAGGGGGGGALLLYAPSISFGASGAINAAGGMGGDTYGNNPGSSTGGGGGSGGGVHLAAASITGISASSVDVSGGAAGMTQNGYYSGNGGEGRLRLDGVEIPALLSGPTGELPTSSQGPAFTEITDTTVTIESSGAVTLYVYDASGAYLAQVALAEDDSQDIYAYLGGGNNHLVLVDDTTGVMGPAGTGIIYYQPDADGDGYNDLEYGGDDCDDDDASVNPGATEYCDTIDNDCDGETDESDAADAVTWYADTDGDGYGDGASVTWACDQPSGYVSDGTDCDDAQADTHPGADEYCDGVDDDCDGDVDEDDAVDATTWYADGDGDGYGDPDTSAVACDEPSGYTATDGDCDDSDAAINPDTAWYIDYDGDGYGSNTYILYQCQQPTGYVDNTEDCDDTDATALPGGTEVCDGVDNDCDGLVDDDDPTVSGASSWYVDADGDGYGSSSTVQACQQPSGTAESSDDCDDGDAAISPDAQEVCNGSDDDCDGDVDEADSSDATAWYLDADGDGYGDPDVSTTACDRPSGMVADSQDCDDGDPAINPPANETCDGRDNDCDGLVDEEEATDAPLWYADDDGDGYGDPGSSTRSCDQPSGYVSDDSDCDDTAPTTNPGAVEIWYDGVDADCDGESDFDADQDEYDSDSYDGADCDDADADIHPGASDSWYDGVDADCDGASDYDADGDGYDSESYGGDDCDDADVDTWPGAPDDPYDGVINDCDDADEYDADGDGYQAGAYGGDDCDDASSDIHPGAEEVWYDGVDQDCDGNDDDQDGDGWAYGEDCDDTDADIWPGAEGWDEDCQPVVEDTGADTEEPDSASPAAADTALGGGAAVKGGGGCACGAPWPSPRAPWLLLLAGLGLWTRRRR